jgi:hypothetical protein
MPEPTTSRRSPFRSDIGNPLIVHCSHHKVGTVWFRRVLSALVDAYDLRLQACRGEPIEAETDIAFYRTVRRFNRAGLGGRPFRGSHVIRDPRDVVVSGYFYHLWTDEQWAHRVDEHAWGGLSYQAYLNSVDRRQGVLAEIKRAAGASLRDMATWDYAQPEFIELRYEDLIADEVATFTRLFQFYGLDDEAVGIGLAGVERHSIRSRPTTTDAEDGPKRHVRSGRAGQWQDLFGPEHVALFKELTGDLLVRLGYESDGDWTNDSPEPAPT